MTKKYKLKTTNKKPPEEERGAETYLAPAPPSKGKIVGLDCHPDTFTAAVFVGQTPHDARKIGARENLSMEALLKWAAAELTPQDIILLEAGSNSFEVCKRLGNLGLQTCVLESQHVGRHKKTYEDNDKMAAARIALVYLAGNAPCVWVPDEQSRERRELLHIYRKSVVDHTAAINAFRGYLNGQGIRPGKRSLEQKTTIQWILKQKDWSALQLQIINEHSDEVIVCKERRKRLYRLIAEQISSDPMMLRCMKVLGVGIVSAFALLAIIGDIKRFHRPEKLVTYIGLNPGRLKSGTSKDIRLGIGKRGRGDLRRLLVQGAHSVMRAGRESPLGQWGWKLFARKGNRNVAVAAMARKLAVQVWHILQGNPPTMLETDKRFTLKLQKVAVTMGLALRKKLHLGASLKECVELLRQRTALPALTTSP